jgi:hypothetical protein
MQSNAGDVPGVRQTNYDMAAANRANVVTQGHPNSSNTSCGGGRQTRLANREIQWTRLTQLAAVSI